LQPITDAGTLVSRLTPLGGHAAIGIDTEFLRERTYYAQLCLLQISSTDDAFCVDTLADAGTDAGAVQALRAILGDPDCCKVLHAARQDLEVLWPQYGVVRNVFDTQLAAGLAGFAPQIGYADLVQQQLQIHLHKDQTRTDWSRRPLSREQLDYALEDVRYLIPIRDLLVQRLQKIGRLPWFEEETLAAARQNESLQADPQRAWQRVKGFGDLDPARQALAQQLAAWREQRAMRANRPRGWLLPDNALRDIVLTVPRNEADLTAITELPEGIRRNSGPELLQLVAAAQVPQPPPPLPRRARPDPEYLALVSRLIDRVRQIAQQHQLAPELLATRREVERLAGGAREGGALDGWRRVVIGEHLLPLLPA
jgi:ribonuclease D